MRSPMPPLPLATLVLLASLWMGCQPPDEPAVYEGCDSTRQCPYNQVCNVLQRRCVPEPENALQGQFFCQQVFPASIDNNVGSFSEVVGKVNLPAPKGGRSLQRMNLISPAYCQIADGYLYVQLFDPDLSIKKEGYYARVVVPVGEVKPGSTLDLTSQDEVRACAARGTQQQIQADLCGQSIDQKILLTVDRAPAPGQPLLGYLDISFQDAPQQAP